LHVRTAVPTAVSGDWVSGSGPATDGDGRDVRVGVMWNLRTGEVTVLPGFGPWSRVLAGQSDASAAADTTRPVLRRCSR